MPSKIKKPEVGSYVSVRTDYSAHKQGFAQNVQRAYEHLGKVVETQSWEGDDVFSLITNDPKMPIKSINMKFVVSIKKMGAKQLSSVNTTIKTAEQEENSEARVFEIKSSSRAGTYAVTKKGSNWTCSCPAGERGRRCKHIGEAQEILRKEKKSEAVPTS